MQLLKGFSLMKEVVMCNKNLRLKSPFILKHRNFDFALSRRGGDTYLKSDF